MLKEECTLPPRPIKITPIFSKKNAELVQLDDDVVGGSKEDPNLGGSKYIYVYIVLPF